MPTEPITTSGKKVTIEENGKVIARGRIYFIHNDLHKEPVGYIEDVYVDEEYRGRGHGVNIVQQLIEIGKEAGCYKIISTSRYSRDKVHEFYQKLGFQDYGKEFRMNLH